MDPEDGKSPTIERLLKKKTALHLIGLAKVSDHDIDHNLRK